MEARRFDQWSTELAPLITRRATLHGLLLVAGPLAAALAPVTLLESAAKKKHRKKKRKKCATGTKVCGRTCIPIDTCCSDVDCDDPAACLDGKCVVPCGQACDDINGDCVTSIDGAQVCAGKAFAELICDAKPCTADSQCGTKEFCSPQNCPPVGGVTNRCFPLQLP